MGTNSAGEGIPYISSVQNPSGQYIELGYVFSGSANTAIYANIANAATASTGDSLAFAIALG
jgi:hypothetical protein